MVANGVKSKQASVCYDDFSSLTSYGHAENKKESDNYEQKAIKMANFMRERRKKNFKNFDATSSDTQIISQSKQFM